MLPHAQAAVSRALVAAIGDVDPTLSLTFRTLSDQVGAQYARERLMAGIAAFFGALALLLTAVGVHGVSAYSVSSRRLEIGIRMALGARRTAVVRTVLVQAAAPVLAGLGAGLIRFSFFVFR